MQTAIEPQSSPLTVPDRRRFPRRSLKYANHSLAARWFSDASYDPRNQ